MKEKSRFLPETINDQQRFYGFNLRNNKEMYESMIDAAEEEYRDFLLSEHQIVVDWQHKLLIAPNSKWKNIFDIIVLLLINFSCFLLCYNICFEDFTEFHTSWLYITIEVLFAISILLTFFTKYQDPDTLVIISSYRKIAMKYFKGWFLIDFLSIFPFEIFSIEYADRLKLIRLLRLPKFIQSIDLKRFDTITSSFWQSDNLLLIFNLRYIFKICRMLIIGVVLTYFLGCFWFFYCKFFAKNNPMEESFIKVYSLDEKKPYEQLIICCYFVITTLTTVGYGDFVARNNNERLFAIGIMFLGVLMFGYIMSSFTDHIALFNQSFADVDKGSTLQNYLFLLNKFTNDNAFNPKLIGAIDKHFSYFWANDRISSFDSKEPFFALLSKDLKMKVVDFLWLDVYCKFAHFFNYSMNKDKYYKFYYELSFVLLPRKFTAGEPIYIRNEEVEEMYLISEGTVNVGIDFDWGRREVRNYAKVNAGDYFGTFECLYNVKSDYYYTTGLGEVKGFAINKFDLLNLLKDYPELSKIFRANAYNKYKDGIKEGMDNAIRGEIEGKVREDGERYEIGDYIKPMINEDENMNGMRIDKFIHEKIDMKNREIKDIERGIMEKVKELSGKYQVTKRSLEELNKKCLEDYKLGNKFKLKIDEEYIHIEDEQIK